MLRTIKILIVFTLLLAINTSIFAAIAITAIGGNEKNRIPQGASVDVLHFKATATVEDDTLNSITIQSTGSAVKLGTNITKVEVFLDGDKDGHINSSSDKSLASKSFDSEVASTELSLSQAITSGNSEQFIIFYTLADDTIIGSTTNIKITDAKDKNNASATNSNPEQNEIIVSGVKTFTATSVISDLIIPNQTKVPFLHFAITVDEEDMNNNMSLTIKNEGNNFVTTSGNFNGVTKVYLYLDKSPIGTFAHPGNTEDLDLDTEIATIETFTSSSELTIPISKDTDKLHEGFKSGAVRNFFLVYDIGKDTIASNTGKISAKITALSGTGGTSKATIKAFNVPSTEASAPICGLGLSSIDSIVPNGSQFGAGNIEAPILKFTLQAFQNKITVQNLTITNEGTIPFINDTKQNGVSKIRIYEDSNGNDAFDGTVSNDTLIGELKLPSGNQSYSATIPIVHDNTAGMDINTFIDDQSINYPQNNAKTFFTIYDFGVNTEINQNVEAKLKNVVGNTSAVINDGIGTKNVSITMNLQGSLPASSSPNAEIKMVETNVYLSEINDISPTSAIQGQTKVPMMYVKFSSIEHFPSASIEILNENKTFLSNNKGASQVWIYRDALVNQQAPSKTLDDKDTLLSARQITTTEMGKAQLSNVEIFSGENHFLILYDIGQIANIATKSIRCQLNNIIGDESGNAIIFGGEIPNPKQSISLDITEKQLKVISVISDVTQITNSGSPTFNVAITLQNLSSTAIEIIDIFPRFYEGSISGTDISSEFTIKSETTLPTSIDAFTTEKTLQFSVTQTKPFTNGKSIIDAYVHYNISNAGQALLSRYQGEGTVWNSTATSQGNINLKLDTNTKYSWIFPTYIENIKIGPTLDSAIPFQQDDSIEKNTNFYIQLEDDGKRNKKDSISLFLNGTQLLIKSNEGSQPGRYSFNDQTGLITVESIGTESGSLVINATDLEGQALDQTILNFSISSQVKISDALFYPNPYYDETGSLKLGFNLTKEADLHIYFYNYLGQLVFQTTKSSSETVIGYNTIDFHQQESFIRSGSYICKIIATDENGKKSNAVTKLAIY